MVEQRNHNPLVGGPNPSAATKDSTPIYRGLIFGIVVDDEAPRVRPAGKRQTRVCRSPEVLTKGDLPRGMKRSETVARIHIVTFYKTLLLLPLLTFFYVFIIIDKT